MASFPPFALRYFAAGEEKIMWVKKPSTCLAIALAGLWVAPFPARALPLDEILSKVQGKYERHEDFKANFVQESLVKTLGKKQVAEGLVYFKKPGKMRWIYQKPNRQEIISDGKNLWNYRPDEKEAIVSPMTRAFQSKVPSTFLAGVGNLRQDFHARWGREPSSRENYFLELNPREAQGSLEKLFLLVDRETFEILQAEIQDLMGNVTQINFSKIEFDNRLSDSLFTFSPPKGVEVFRMPGTPPAVPPGK